MPTPGVVAYLCAVAGAVIIAGVQCEKNHQKQEREKREYLETLKGIERALNK